MSWLWEFLGKHPQIGASKGQGSPRQRFLQQAASGRAHCECGAILPRGTAGTEPVCQRSRLGGVRLSEREGRTEEARTLWEEVVKSSPGSKLAERAQKHLKRTSRQSGLQASFPPLKKR